MDLAVRRRLKSWLKIPVTALLVLFLTAPVVAVDVQGRLVAQRVLQSSVVIGTTHADTGCGGTLLSRATVLTAAHCMVGVFIDRVKVYDYWWDGYEIASIRIDKARDLAILTLTKAVERPVPALLGESIEVGEIVYSTGAPFPDFMLTRGIVGKVSRFQFGGLGPSGDIGNAEQEYLWLDIRTYYGFSGGGVFNNEGKLVGTNVRMIVFKEPDEEYKGQFVLWSIAISLNSIRTFLEGR